MQNPLRTDFQRHYEDIVAEYNREKDRVTIEKSFEAFLRFAQELTDEDRRAIREGLDEESLAIFDLLKKSELSPAEIKKIKSVAVELLKTLKAENSRSITGGTRKPAGIPSVSRSGIFFGPRRPVCPSTNTTKMRCRPEPRKSTATCTAFTQRFPRRFMR
jgi:hypothetical protein